MSHAFFTVLPVSPPHTLYFQPVLIPPREHVQPLSLKSMELILPGVNGLCCQGEEDAL